MQHSVAPMRRFHPCLQDFTYVQVKLLLGKLQYQPLCIISKDVGLYCYMEKSMTPADTSFSQRNEGENQWGLKSSIGKCSLVKAFRVFPQTEVCHKGLIQRIVDRGRSTRSRAKTWGSHSNQHPNEGLEKTNSPILLLLIQGPRIHHKMNVLFLLSSKVRVTQSTGHELDLSFFLLYGALVWSTAFLGMPFCLIYL